MMKRRQKLDLHLLNDYTFRIVALGSGILGFVSGSIGSFAVLRKQSLLGDAISHASLPGIVLVFMFTGSKAPFVLMAGAAVSGWLGTYFILSIIRNTRVDTDSALGIILSIFFGLGLLLLTFLQKRPTASQAGLDKFLFGQAAALLPSDIITMSVFGAGAVFLMIIFWKEFKITSFNPSYGESMGFKAYRIDLMITALIVISIVIGLQTVGVILMSFMVVAPSCAARQWTKSLSKMVILSGIFGSVSGIAGSLISSSVPDMPTGPTIVICLSVIFIFSIFFAPQRGLLVKALRQHRNRYRFSIQKLLLDINALENRHPQKGHFHETAIIALGRTGREKKNINAGLKALADKGYAEKDNKERWRLTLEGNKKANRILEGNVDEI